MLNWWYETATILLHYQYLQAQKFKFWKIIRNNIVGVRPQIIETADMYGWMYSLPRGYELTHMKSTSMYFFLNTDYIHRHGNLRCHVIIRSFQTWLRIRRYVKFSEKHDAQPVISDGHVSSSFGSKHICTIYTIVMFSDGRCHWNGSSHEKASYSTSKSSLPEISKFVSVYAVKAYGEVEV